MRKKLRDNGLTIALFLIFAVSFAGQIVTGHHVYNEEQHDHHQPQVGLVRYLTTGHFVEALFENWESEFLQMASYTLFTAFLFQRGSAESKDPDKEDEVDADTQKAKKPDSPAPVRKGGALAKLYENSLSLSLLSLFVLSFLLHAAGGAKEYSADQVLHGGQAVGFWGYLGTSQFWFESFQNWQSEFFSLAVMVVFSIYLRQKGSSQSKPVHAPNSQTGSD